jgi:hypothetical protein
MRIGTDMASGSQVVLLDNGYLLRFVFTTPDDASRDKLVETMQSVHFFEK